MNKQIVDHLFRTQYGRLVAILTRIFGLSNIETIEDAVQDTFISAMQSWRKGIPENPEAWLTKAAKNRTIDLFRKVKSDKLRSAHFGNGPSAIHLNEYFLEHEIEDSQLRMVFTACHPVLNPKEQLAFALKTISGFGIKEIASALLIKSETIKKRLSRARKIINVEDISFEIPIPEEIPERLKRVHEVIYLTFNEGFHSTNPNHLVRHELCAEAIRLCDLLLKKEITQSPNGYALLALMCFHAARLESKISSQNQILDLKSQDRSKWNIPMIMKGNDAMMHAVETEDFSSYHFEAAIVGEHLKASSFEKTNWKQIGLYYDQLYKLQANPMILLNKVIVLLQLQNLTEAYELLMKIEPNALEQRAYLYFGTLAEYHISTKETGKAISALEKAILLVSNAAEKSFLIQKKEALLS